MPFIIDDEIRYDSSDIPGWFRNYNLRKVCKPTKVVALINEKITELTWSKSKFLKQKESIFIGRNEFVESFENRYYDSAHGHAIFYFISGFESIGRRSFIKYCLKKVGKVHNSYNFPILDLDSNDSVEDFIAKLNDLGIAPEQKIEGLLSTDLEEKVEICASLIKTYYNNDEVVLVNDRGAIVKSNGKLSDWFKKLLCKFDNKAIGIKMAICSKVRVSTDSSKIFNITMPELSPRERIRLLIEYLKLFKVTITEDEFKLCTNWLQGFPHQVFYLVESINSHTFSSTLQNSNIIVNYSLSKAETILSEYKEDSWKIEFIATISKIEIANVRTLCKAFGDDQKYNELLADLILKNICSYEGISGEYIRLSEIISDYIVRKRIQHCKTAFNILKGIIKKELEGDTGFEQDLPSIYLTMKESILDGNDLDNKYIFPSHLAKCIKEIYISREDDGQVIKIAEYMISKEKTISADMLNIAKYYLCLALARKKDMRVLSEACMLNQVDRRFVIGFFFRRTGEYVKAISELTECLNLRKNHERAKSELVTCYIRTGNLSGAYKLARECYYNNKSSVYFAQSYFDCLLHRFSRSQAPEDAQEMKLIIDSQVPEDNKKDSSIVATMSSKYYLYVDNSPQNAFDAISKHTNDFGNDLFTLNAEFSIYEKLNDIGNMKRINEMILQIIKNTEQYMDIIHSNRIRVTAKEFGIAAAMQEIEALPTYFSEDFKVRLSEKIRQNLY